MESKAVRTEPGVLPSILAVVEHLAVQAVVGIVTVLLLGAGEFGGGEELEGFGFNSEFN